MFVCACVFVFVLDCLIVCACRSRVALLVVWCFICELSVRVCVRVCLFVRVFVCRWLCVFVCVFVCLFVCLFGYSFS